MIIKVKLEGALLETLKSDAEQNLRTHPSQIIYYLRQIYAEQLGTPTGATPAHSITPVGEVKSPEDLIWIKEVTEKDIISPEVPAVEPLVLTGELLGERTGSSLHQEDTIDILDDILNF